MDRRVFDQRTDRRRVRRLDVQFVTSSWKYERGCRGDGAATLHIAALLKG